MKFLVVLLAVLSAAGAAHAADVVEAGDVLLVAVAEDAKLGRDAAKVGSDGQIQLPLIGGINAAGSDVGEIRERISKTLEERQILRKPTVLVEISLHRPFYVGGAVKQPGAIAYEPGLTVRHAVALAGGVSTGSDRAPASTGPTELRTKWQSNALNLVEIDSRIARLRAELASGTVPDFSAISTVSADSEAASAIMALDTNILADSEQNWNAGQKQLKDAVAMIDFEIDVLRRQAELQQHEIELQGDQVAKSRELRERGLIPLSQLQELEREQSSLMRDRLENQAYGARAKQNKATAQYNLETADTKRRMEVHESLRDALLERSRALAEAQVLGEALARAGISTSAMGPTFGYVIHRSSGGADEAVNADLGTAILPGDLLEVNIVDSVGG